VGGDNEEEEEEQQEDDDEIGVETEKRDGDQGGERR
jgi:hypothetical protein